jgi:hypothetical protein
MTVAAVAALSAEPSAGQDGQVNSMRDLQAHFAACFRAPLRAEGSQVTFRFSLTRDGQLYGKPIMAWASLGGAPEKRKALRTEFLTAFERCLPVTLSEKMAATTPGGMYFLRLAIGADAKPVEIDLGPID